MMKNVHIGWGPVGMTKITSDQNKLRLNASKVALELGENVKLSIISEYEETPVWYSSNEEVAKVDQEGNVTVIGPGITYITVTSGALKGVCVITVANVDDPDEPSTPDNIPVTGIILDVTTLNINVGESKQIIANVLPQDATNTRVSWNSDNVNVATVNNGIIYAKDDGIAHIMVTTEDGGFTAICTVIVTDPNKPTSKLDNTKIYYGTVQAPLITSFTELTEDDIIRAVESETMKTSSITTLEKDIIVPNQGDLVVVLIPQSRYKSGIVEINGSKHEYDDTVTGLNFCANGELKLGDFYVFGKWMFATGLLKIYVE